MPRFYFDLHESEKSFRDDVGHEVPDLEEARTEAMKALPGIAFDKISKDGDRQSFVCLVTDEDGKRIYSATLSYVGQWLLR